MTCSAPEWTGEFVSDLHMANVTIKALAEEAGMNPKYIGQVLRGKEKSKKAEAKLHSALASILEKRKEAQE